MTGHERKILRAERHLKEMQELLDSVPQRVRSMLPDSADGDNVIAFLTERCTRDIEETRKQLEELKKASTQL
jgi:hypothetical protein